MCGGWEWGALTFHMALTVLAHHSCIILFICRPLVDVHGCMGGTCIQYNAIL